MSEEKKEQGRVSLKDGRDYSAEAARAAATETAQVSGFAEQWAMAQVNLIDITDETGHFNQAQAEKIAAAALLFGKVMKAQEGRYYNDAIEQAEADILDRQHQARTEEFRKTKGGIILPSLGMLKNHLRPDQFDFLNGAGGLKS